MFIHEAANRALQELGVPTHVSAIHRHIVDNEYYDFGAIDPENALAIQLSRRSVNVDISHSNPEKVFYRAAPATYGLVDWFKGGDESHSDHKIAADVSEIIQSERTTTEKEQLILARIGQGSFRCNVLTQWNHCCAVTGSTLTLRASHIKPWCDCSDTERLDTNNGLPLIATLDVLFDSHLISFDRDGCIMLSDRIPEHEQLCLAIDGSMRLRRPASAEMEAYLKEHRALLGH